MLTRGLFLLSYDAHRPRLSCPGGGMLELGINTGEARLPALMLTHSSNTLELTGRRGDVQYADCEHGGVIAWCMPACCPQSHCSFAVTTARRTADRCYRTTRNPIPSQILPHRISVIDKCRLKSQRPRHGRHYRYRRGRGRSRKVWRAETATFYHRRTMSSCRFLTSAGELQVGLTVSFANVPQAEPRPRNSDCGLGTIKSASASNQRETQWSQTCTERSLNQIIPHELSLITAAASIDFLC